MKREPFQYHNFTNKSPKNYWHVLNYTTIRANQGKQQAKQYQSNDASNSSKSSSNESTIRQHKRNKAIKARNLRNTTVELYFNKKRGGRLYLKRVRKKRSRILPEETWNKTATTSTSDGKSKTTVTKTAITTRYLAVSCIVGAKKQKGQRHVVNAFPDMEDDDESIISSSEFESDEEENKEQDKIEVSEEEHKDKSK
eukprot:3502271-Ditylum_brightwellii.AAC.1